MELEYMRPQDVWGVPRAFKPIPYLVRIICGNWLNLTEGL